MTIFQSVVFLFAWTSASAANNGLARTPPMGWRSWNAFDININQEIMQSMMDRMTERVRLVDGVPTSLLDLGYNDCGLDDGWQDAGAGVNGSYHDADGHPLINKSKFPDMKAMTSYGHQRKLTVGWYMNNCNPHEPKSEEPGYEAKHMHGDVNALFTLDFDGVKLDACGPYTNLTWWYQLINATKKAMLIENCHWGGDAPPCPGDDCPYNFWRVGTDIANTWDLMFSRIQLSRPYLYDPPLSRPGTWAYPDMLEVGKMPSFYEDRTHFGLWVITSSPLILGLDLNNHSAMDRVWPVIANPEAIAINQVWSGHPGQVAKEKIHVLPQLLLHAMPCNASQAVQRDWKLVQPDASVDLHEIQSISTGLCVDAATPHPLQFTECTGAKSQLFFYNRSSGTIQAPFAKNNDGRLNGCLDIVGKHGPGVQLTHCYGEPNDMFSFSASGVWTGGSGVNPYPHRCMQIDNATETQGQVWAKRQPGGSMAVFAVNSLLSSLAFEIDLKKDLNMTNAPAFAVRDVWARRDLPGYVTDRLVIDAITRHDSRLYMLKPVKESVLV